MKKVYPQLVNSSCRVGEIALRLKCLSRRRVTERILGAHIADPHDDKQINIFDLVIPRGITSEDLKEIIFS